MLSIVNSAKQKLHSLTSDKKFSEILKGSVWAFSAHVISACFSMVISIIIARFYGAEAMGIVAVITSYLTLVTIFTVLGTNTSILRLIPEHIAEYSHTSAFKVYRKTQYFVMGVSLVTGCLFYFGAGIVSNKIFSKPHLISFFALAAPFIIFKSLMLLNTQAVRGLRLIKTFAFMQALPALSNLLFLVILTIFLYAQGNPVHAYLISLLVTAIVGWLIMEYSFKQKMRPQDNVENMSTGSILRLSMPMLMTATMSFLIGQTGVIILGMFRNEAEVGYYSIAVRLATLTAFVLQAINSMAAPKFSELYHAGKMDELFYIAKKSTKLIFLSTAPILIILIAFGKPILAFLFGGEFTIAYLAMVFLVVGQFVNSISGSTGLFMNMTGNQKVLRNISCGAATINVVLNLLLIPTLGIIGAALAGMISIIFWNCYTLAYIKRKYGQTIGYIPITLGTYK